MSAWRSAYAALPSWIGSSCAAAGGTRDLHNSSCHLKNATTRRISSAKSKHSSCQRWARARALHHSIRRAGLIFQRKNIMANISYLLVPWHQNRRQLHECSISKITSSYPRSQQLCTLTQLRRHHLADGAHPASW